MATQARPTCINTIETTTLYNLNDTLIQDEKLIGDLDHILQYLSNFEPLSTTDENSEDLIPMIKVVDLQATPLQQQQYTVEEVDYLDGSDHFEEIHLSEIKQFSEIIEEKRNASSSFIMIYNNVHYLKEAVIFDCIMDFYFKPSNDRHVIRRDSYTFLQFLTLRQVCKHWKRMIDEKYGRNFILSILQDRVKCRDCNPNADFILFRIPMALTIVACWWPSWLAGHLELTENVQAYALGLSCYLTYMIVGGNPMLVPVGVLGCLVDAAMENIKERRFFNRLQNRYDELEQDIISEISLVDKCEIISTIQDHERFYNNHSCFYIVQVTLCIDGKTLGYRIKKKYTQFRELYFSMCKCIKKDVLEVTSNDDGDVLERIEFPAKRWSFFSNSDKVIEERREIFQKMLNLIVDDPDLFDSTNIYSFFHDKNQQHALLGNTATETGEEDGFLVIDNQ